MKSVAEQAADSFADTVSTEGRVLNTMHVDGKAYMSVTSVVRASFLAGYKAARAAELTFGQLIEANAARVERWHGINDWSPLEWAGAMCGEAGEAANFAKKLKRAQTGIQNKDGRLAADVFGEAQIALYRRSVVKEVADTIIYGLLLCLAAGEDADAVVATIRDVFNEKSKEYGFPERV